MRKRLMFLAALTVASLVLLTTFAGAAVNAVTPSTNDTNRTNNWAHVDQLSQGVGTTDLQFISTRAFYSCFEYRTDGDTSQILSENGGVNYNSLVTDGLYPYVCKNNSSETLTITAKKYVEVRMVFGAESDERFDWTRFDVLPACHPTGLFRDGINLTASVVNPAAPVTGSVDAGGCNIGVYYGPGRSGTVSGANISGANYYGVVANAASVNVTNSSIHNIGEVPFNGTQHGVGVLYTTINQALETTGLAANGTLSGNTITRYQKNGVVVSGTGAVVTVQNNTVTGNGQVDYIAQNGIQMSYGATGTINGNTVSNNEYTGANLASSGGIIVVGGAFYFGLPYSTGINVIKNVVTNNDVGIWLSNAAADGSAPLTKTNNKVVNNTISKTDGVTNLTGSSSTCGYQAGIADEGNKDNIVNNTISGNGYVPTTGCSTGTFRTNIDSLGNNHINNN